MTDIPPSPRLSGDATLVKQNLAAALQREILNGRLLPGQRIVEGTWARKFGVAQASVREAINILVTEGFAEKRSGRSARVTQYSEEDVARLYEVRSALEGLAAFRTRFDSRFGCAGVRVGNNAKGIVRAIPVK